MCWLGRDSQRECVELARELWSKGLAVDLLPSYMELDTMEDIQDLCRHTMVPHIVVVERSLLLSGRKQVRVRSVEGGRVTEKVVGVADLVEYLQPRHGLEKRCVHNMVISEFVQTLLFPVIQLSKFLLNRPELLKVHSFFFSSCYSSMSPELPTATSSLPPVTITNIGRQKFPTNVRRKMDSMVR